MARTNAPALLAHRTSAGAALKSLRGDRSGIPVRTDALTTAILDLQRSAGNQAVASLLSPVQRQKDVGWTDASDKGRAWNKGQAEVGEIHRIPLEGLAKGLKPKPLKKGGPDKSAIPELTSESAPGKAIVLVPKTIKAPNPEAKTPEPKIDVVVFLHGHTEDASSRPYAGWRELNPETGVWKGKGDEDFVHSLRHGLPDEKGKAKDTAPVRDVALDEAEQQLQESGSTQTIMVLPQGGLRSDYGDLNAAALASEVVGRLQKSSILGAGSADQIIGRITLGGHSGAGATLAQLARQSVNLDTAAKAAAKKPAKEGKAAEPTPAPPLSGDLIIYDAIWGGTKDWQYKAFRDWALMRLTNDLAELKTKTTDADKEQYLRSAPKLRGYYSTGKHGGSYVTIYVELQGAIDHWFKLHGDELGSYAGCLRENFNVDHPIPVSHEELMRGVLAGDPRAGKGTILDALKALDPMNVAPGGVCPALPASAKPDRKPVKQPVKKQSSPGIKEEEKVPVGSRR